jgi:hypothetical protein
MSGLLVRQTGDKEGFVRAGVVAKGAEGSIRHADSRPKSVIARERRVSHPMRVSRHNLRDAEHLDAPNDAPELRSVFADIHRQITRFAVHAFSSSA